MNETRPNQSDPHHDESTFAHAVPTIPTEDEGCPSHASANTSLSDHAEENDPEEATNQDELEEKSHQIGVNISIKVKRRSGSRSKHRAGKNRKRRWRPYSKLSWDERMALDERDARRAHKTREQMSASGIVLAPYNTTQFLMNDHDIQSPDYGYAPDEHKPKDDKHSGNSDDGYIYSEDEEFLSQQFKEDYDNFHDQYLNSLSQEELAYQWVELEDQIEMLEKRISRVRQDVLLRGYTELDRKADLEKIEVFRAEIKKMIVENTRLEMSNNSLNGFLQINFVR